MEIAIHVYQMSIRDDQSFKTERIFFVKLGKNCADVDFLQLTGRLFFFFLGWGGGIPWFFISDCGSFLN